jgi:large subunit ribosomal protein L2
MALTKYKPTTPTRRFTVLLKTANRNDPERSLLAPMKSKAGRNNRGVVTMRHQGSGVKRRFRVIDFKRDKRDIPAVVVGIEYDPNRTGNIALIAYADGEKRYMLAPSGLKAGDKIMNGEKAPINVGNSLPLKAMPLGTTIYNIELTKGKGGQIVRSAGAMAQIQSMDKGYVQIKLPSGEIRLVNAENYATIGGVGNEELINVKLGKAGRKRHMGIRPSVRGMAMHAEQHPHGGGEGKGQVGGKSKDIWGNRRGRNTRRNKVTSKFIVKRRKGKKINK